MAAVMMIGVDPHKGSHTAVAIGAAEELLGQVRVRACAAQAQRLLAWASAWPERTWAVEGAGGRGHLLAQQLIAAGERVLDVQPKLAARVRLLAAGTVNKNDPNDAGSVAVAALRSAACPQVRADDHAVLCDLIPGGVGKRAGTSRPGYGWRSRSATSQRPVSTGGRRGAVARSAMRSTPLGPEGTAP